MTGRPTKRAWFRYSLRTLLLLATVVSVSLGMALKRARDRKEAVETIRALGGAVYYQHQRDGTEPPGPPWLRSLLGDELFFSVDYVSLLGPKFNDENVAMIRLIPEATWLSSYHSNITDDGLKHFRRLRRLEELYLTNLQITDAGLRHLEGLDRLRKVQVYTCSLDITTEGKKRLMRALPRIDGDDGPVRSGTMMLGE